MFFLSRAALTLLKAPGVLCYFNPNGEVLRDLATFQDLWDKCNKQEKIPLALWMNVRYFHLNEMFSFMDTVGNSQLDVLDVEAIFPKGKYHPNDIDYYLRNVTHYLLDSGREIRSGENIDGPGESNLSWTAKILKDGTIEPPREVLQLCPKSDRRAIQDALKAVRR